MARSLNRAQLIGNLTRDPELRYTPNGAAVCSFSIATNRNWTTDAGEKREEADFHRIVAWNKLAELCSQFLVKGRKVYVEGRLSTRTWTAQDGTSKSTTEVVIDDMILLDSRRPEDAQATTQAPKKEEPPVEEAPKSSKKTEKPARNASPARQSPAGSSQMADGQSDAGGEVKEEEKEEVAPDDIPF